jgi:putative transposase
MIEPANKEISIRKQCELAGLNRRSYYNDRQPETDENLMFMKLIDREYTDRPFYGSRRMVQMLKKHKHQVNRKRVQRLMRKMGLEAIYPKRRLSFRGQDSEVFPYLLRDVKIDHPDQVWAADITYIPMKNGFMYLVAIIDWYSRKVISWDLSNSMTSDFCVRALELALRQGTPEIFNTDQGSQFGSKEFTKLLKDKGVKISMDSKGRCYDNIFVERFWRTVKHEEVYIKAYIDGHEARQELEKYFRFYNMERPHQSFDYKTPDKVYREAA